MGCVVRKVVAAARANEDIPQVREQDDESTRVAAAVRKARLPAVVEPVRGPVVLALEEGRGRNPERAPSMSPPISLATARF